MQRKLAGDGSGGDEAVNLYKSGLFDESSLGIQSITNKNKKAPNEATFMDQVRARVRMMSA